MLADDTRAFIAGLAGQNPRDEALWIEALTHGSTGEPRDYQRLEFLGDRVLGLAIAEWLHEKGGESEGKLSQRLNALVAGTTCAGIARGIGLGEHLRLGKQARDDGANQSDNVIGDAVESLMGALLIDGGLEKADAFIRRAWAPFVDAQGKAPKHPKSALQELAAARNWAAPEYEIARKSGAHHAPRFTVKVGIRNVGEATAEGSSKQEAETAAASALLDELK